MSGTLKARQDTKMRKQIYNFYHDESNYKKKESELFKKKIYLF